MFYLFIHKTVRHFIALSQKRFQINDETWNRNSNSKKNRYVIKMNIHNVQFGNVKRPLVRGCDSVF